MGAVPTRLPPEVPDAPYKIGVGDVIVLATKSQAGTSVEALSGLLAAQNRRQGYTVQDDGAIAIPDVGRVKVAGLTIEETEQLLFQRLVESQIEPSFSVEIAEFNARRVSIGGAVRSPVVVPITLTPLYLDAALAQAGGVSAGQNDLATIRIYRDGKLYQIPLDAFYSRVELKRVRLVDGDSIYVDTAYDLESAQGYFAEQIKLAELRQSARGQALAELETEIGLRRAALAEERSNFEARLELGAEPRDYVYLTGEVTVQRRFPLPFGQKASLADALYAEGGSLTMTGNPAQIYVLRGATGAEVPTAITAYHLDARNAVNFVLATKFELRPDDVIFVAEQPITRWNRVIQQFVPSLITSGVAAASSNSN